VAFWSLNEAAGRADEAFMRASRISTMRTSKISTTGFLAFGWRAMSGA
jgi:hypothetical protein